ncbi:MAG: hypothetical protein JEZ12_22235 [Desulfobacterium sp.]|nr:hypothetical protein [Desulfobacterium sp.]
MIAIEKKQTSPHARDAVPPHSLEQITVLLGIDTWSADAFIRSLPFCAGDATAGVENEFQAVVVGRREDVDLPISIEASNYYKNLVKQAKSGDTPEKRVIALENFLGGTAVRPWENSWVRFPRSTLNPFANLVLNQDLKADKSNYASGYRNDAGMFVFKKAGEPHIRIPVSYLLKLSLAQAIGADTDLPPQVKNRGKKMMDHFSNDNSSPELFSFHPVKANTDSGLGAKLAGETLIRFLLTQALVRYAEDDFLLKANGQRVKVFFSATPPMRQRQLNDCISDAFYRELFMSPCLSGWDRGEEKHTYMNICHKVLSRSQINAVTRLKEAGIITSNLVVMPNLSNISLANNGTHISMGSIKLSSFLADKHSGFTDTDEKQVGDLAIKICEHFLPLFSTTFSASPHRLNFEDFHPERLLGFLPHELEDNHLRMIWRRWKKKANLKIMGHPLTPFGPVWLDRLISRSLGLKGDFIPDSRLIDYFVSVKSTFQSPALDGSPKGEAMLKKDLTEMGIFDERMPLYQLIRLRKQCEMGYSGFEHRYASIFEDITRDMGGAADLQLLITGLAQKYIFSKEVDHPMIPDSPEIESERRQIFFAGAIGLPTFFVKTRTRNLFLTKILQNVRKTRSSRRYPGYTRVYVKEYQQGLIRLLRKDGASLMEAFRMKPMVDDLEKRINDPGTHAAWGRLTSGILGEKKTDPMAMQGTAFNERAEAYYGDTLRKAHISQGFDQLERACETMKIWAGYRDAADGDALDKILGQEDLFEFLKAVRGEFCENTLARKRLKKLIYLIILVVNRDVNAFEASIQ